MSGRAKKIFRGMIWSGIDRFAMQGVQFILGLYLARLLDPQDYGTLSILLVFIIFSTLFVEGGFSNALIQKEDRNRDDVSTTFSFNIGVALVLYTVLFFSSPAIASSLDTSELSLYLRVLALGMIINSIYLVPNVLLKIDLNFRLLAKINFISTTISGVIAIWMAYGGYGIWALIVQNISRNLINLLLYAVLTKWDFSFKFSVDSFKKLYKYGVNLLVSSLLSNLVSQASSLIIMKFYSTASLGLFTRGRQFTDFFSATIDSIINKVMLPGLSDLQNDREELRNKFMRVFGLTSFLAVPIFLGLCSVAEPLILALLKEKWEASILIVQIFCFARLLHIYCALLLNVIYITGETHLLLKIQPWIILVRVLSLAATIPFGIYWIAVGEVIATAIHLMLYSQIFGKLIRFQMLDLIKHVAKYWLGGGLILGGVFTIISIPENQIVASIIGILTGIVVYVLYSFMILRGDIGYIRKLIKI